MRRFFVHSPGTSGHKERERKHCIPSAPCAIQRTERCGRGNAARWLPCTGGGSQRPVHHLSKEADADPPSIPPPASAAAISSGGLGEGEWRTKIGTLRDRGKAEEFAQHPDFFPCFKVEGREKLVLPIPLIPSLVCKPREI